MSRTRHGTNLEDKLRVKLVGNDQELYWLKGVSIIPLFKNNLFLHVFKFSKGVLMYISNAPQFQLSHNFLLNLRHGHCTIKYIHSKRPPRCKRREI